MRNIYTIAAAAVAITLAATPLAAQSIAVGQEGRGYEAKGKALAGQLQNGWNVKNFTGSEDIARAVCDSSNETPIGIAQIDAVRVMEAEGCVLQTIGIYPSIEYAFIMFPPKGGDSLSDLDETSSILVDQIGSGTALFWQTIVGIEAEHGNGSSWADAKPVYSNIVFAETMAATGEIDALILVGNPNSQDVYDLIAAGWELGEFSDKDINDLKFRGSSLYSRETVVVDVPGKFFDIKEDAYVVPAFFIANKEWAAANMNDVTRIARLVKTLR